MMEKAVVLIVEDEALIRMDSALIVEDAGFAVLEASNADEAVAILAVRSDVQAVIADIKMPGSMDGLKLAHAIRDRWPPIHLILTSGASIPNGYKLPENIRFIPKPYGIEQVTAALCDIFSTPHTRIGGVSHLYQTWRHTSLQFARGYR